jgi:hypothetical protein
MNDPLVAKGTDPMSHPIRRPLSRRMLLRAGCVVLGLPLLEAMRPMARARAAADLPPRPRRMVLINACLGLYGPDFFPAETGRDYTLSPYLRELADRRGDFTVMSGLSHPEVGGGGHTSEASFLTAAPHPSSPSFRNSISLDQLAAEHVGPVVRHPYLALGTIQGSLSWTRNGVQIPSDKDPGQVFRRLFIAGTPEEVRAQERLLQEGRSVLDSVRAETSALQRRVGDEDRDRLDQYFTAVREVEKRLVTAATWVHRPKPRVTAEPPGPVAPPADIVGRVAPMYDLIRLALQTDSTRIVTLSIDQTGGVPPISGVTDGYHPLSHHGMDPEKIDQLRLVERAELRALAGLLRQLKETAEPGGSLLDSTMVLYGSNLGNASSHDPSNLPILLAGGGFAHGQHLAFDRRQNAPLANLYVTMLQRFGIETDRFGSSAGTLTGLEMT